MTASGQERGGQSHTTALVRVAPRKRPYATCLNMSGWWHKRTFALQQISYSMISSVRGLRTCLWARLVIRVFGVRLHSSVGGVRATNRKRVLVPSVMGAGGRQLLNARDDIEVVAFPTT